MSTQKPGALSLLCDWSIRGFSRGAGRGPGASDCSWAGFDEEYGGRVGVDYSSFGLKDRIAIVTGASQGIGRALAVGLASAGAHLVLAKHPTGRHEEIKEVQAEIESLGRQARIVLTDVAQVDQVRAMVDEAQRAFIELPPGVNRRGGCGSRRGSDRSRVSVDR